MHKHKVRVYAAHDERKHKRSHLRESTQENETGYIPSLTYSNLESISYDS